MDQCVALAATQAAPRMGDTDALLGEAGFDAAAIAKLRQIGVIDAASARPHATSADAGHAAGP